MWKREAEEEVSDAMWQEYTMATLRTKAGIHKSRRGATSRSWQKPGNGFSPGDHRNKCSPTDTLILACETLVGLLTFKSVRKYISVVLSY